MPAWLWQANPIYRCYPNCANQTCCKMLVPWAHCGACLVWRLPLLLLEQLCFCPTVDDESPFLSASSNHDWMFSWKMAFNLNKEALLSLSMRLEQKTAIESVFRFVAVLSGIVFSVWKLTASPAPFLVVTPTWGLHSENLLLWASLLAFKKTKPCLRGFPVSFSLNLCI